MSDSDVVDVNGKNSNDRTVMHVLYGLHTVAWLSAGTFAVIALIVNYIRRGDETDPTYLGHHNYMIRTFWWTVLWLILLFPLWFLLVFPGAVAYFVVGLWYLYRCIRGWSKFLDGKPAPLPASRASV